MALQAPRQVIKYFEVCYAMDPGFRGAPYTTLTPPDFGMLKALRRKGSDQPNASHRTLVFTGSHI